jgi:aminoglycoside phosphotransferase family enzyme/predicted kinase
MGGDQDETIAFLEQPSTYGPAVVAVERIDTHASVLFLAGARAYKLKRAVRYSYLDYSTPDLRRIACKRELELNWRTAPELYLRVVPVTRDEAGLALGGAGAAVDWLVEMVRFDQSALFDHMAEEGRLTERLMRDLADRIAAFHDGAEVDRRAGGASTIAKVIRGNHENIRAHAGAFDLEQIERLRSGSERALASIAELLDRRREGGHVRLCHGDLHLRNICLLDGRPTLFDCIEFSDEIQRIDVLYDLAFLLMDLRHRQLGRHANQVFNRYMDLRDEGDGLAALPLFLSLRAAIRSHTGAATAARQPDPGRAEALRRENASYLTAALAFLKPSPPSLIAVGGLSGTGKTSLAYRLAPEIGRHPGARVLRSDVLRKRLIGVAPEMRLGEHAYTPAMSERVYRTLYQEAEAALASGQAIVADAAFLREDERAAIASVAQAARVPFAALWLEAPMATLQQRIQVRRQDASDANIAVLRRQPELLTGRIDWLRLDASAGDPERIASMARSALAPVVPGMGWTEQP